MNAVPSCFRGVDANSRDKIPALERSYTQSLPVIAQTQNLVSAVLLYTENSLASEHPPLILRAIMELVDGCSKKQNDPVCDRRPHERMGRWIPCPVIQFWYMHSKWTESCS